MDAESQDNSLNATVGRNVAERRTASNVRQDVLASALFERGLSWTANRVSRLETGDKAIQVAELVLIADALSEVTREPVSVADLLSGTGRVDLSDSVNVPWELVTEFFRGVPVNLARANDPDAGPAINSPLPGRIFKTINKDLAFYNRLMGTRHDHPDTFEALTSPGLADVTLAKKLKVPLAHVLCASIGLWGRSLTDQRDHIVGTKDTAEPGVKGKRRKATTELQVLIQERLEAEARGELPDPPTTEEES